MSNMGDTKIWYIREKPGQCLAESYFKPGEIICVFTSLSKSKLFLHAFSHICDSKLFFILINGACMIQTHVYDVTCQNVNIEAKQHTIFK